MKRKMNRESDDIKDLEAAAAIFDYEYFEKIAQKDTKRLDTHDFDSVDQWLADVFMESYKAKDETITDIFHINSPSRSRLPQARPLEVLLDAMTYKATSASEGSAGFELASQAWNAINKNYYISDHMKRHICNAVAIKTNRIYDRADRFEREHLSGSSNFVYEELYDLNYSRPSEKFPNILAELKAGKSLDDIVVEAADEEVVLAEEIEETVEAVMDEDQL